MAIVDSAHLIEVSFAAVNGVQREKNHQVLQPVLTDLIALASVIKQLHWNVTGPNFRSIHLHLDEIFEVVETGVDDVAERLSAIGHSPDGRIHSVAANAVIEDAPHGFLKENEVLAFAEHSIKRTAELIRSRTAEIEDVDTASADLLHQIVLSLEKHHWMIQASRIV